MTIAPLQSDMVLWHTLRTRRKRQKANRGLDAVANRWLQRLRHARKGMRHLHREVEAVERMSKQMAELSETALDEQIEQIRQPFARRYFTQDHVRIALAVVRETSARTTGEKPYRVQLMGALGMFHGQIVEMLTGEGKTLAVAVAATLLGWQRLPVHLVTVNDYLAQRDAHQNQLIYRRCGLEAAAVVNETPHPQRAEAYMKPLVYITQKELVADWLRDKLRLGRLTEPVSARWLSKHLFEDMVRSRRSGQSPIIPGLHVAIVDEVDALLIDEAVTPLIIAQPRREDPQAQLYERARDLAEQLAIDRDFILERARRHVSLTVEGQRRIESLLDKNEHAVWRASRRRDELVEQALTARFYYHEGQHYQIVEDQVTIVDEYTGRFMHDRQWQHGMHQAIEAKHDLDVTADRDTLASMTFQRFFRQYPHLCGTTGTAADAKPELETTYGLPVRVIPTRRPGRRKDLGDQIYARTSTKWDMVVERIERLHEEGRPVLVGTRSIEASELLSGLLGDRQLPHQVLNAVHHREEADIVAAAGKNGSITVATNMAGRGTDIKLAPGVAERGGLQVILTERHAARRIDRQFFGRAGRQGDPGSTQCILSLEDDLLLQQVPKRTEILRRLYMNRDRPLPSWASGLYALAQTRAQRQAFQSRAAVVRHEDHLDRMLPLQ